MEMARMGLVANLGIQAGFVSSIIAQDPYQMGYEGVGKELGPRNTRNDAKN
jgi:hypothetical protein